MLKNDDVLGTESKISEIEAIKHAIKNSKDKRMYQRYIVILLHLKGSSNKSIADALDLCQHTVGTYIRKCFGFEFKMILDNAKIHHAKLIQPFLEEQSSILELVFLPPYSPNINFIEGLWVWLKSEIINNVFYTVNIPLNIEPRVR